MGGGLRRLLESTPTDVWDEVPGTVVSLDTAGGHVVSVRGLSLGPVWSVNGRQHAAGASVTVLMRGGVAVGLTP